MPVFSSAGRDAVAPAVFGVKSRAVGCSSWLARLIVGAAGPLGAVGLGLSGAAVVGDRLCCRRGDKVAGVTSGDESPQFKTRRA